jgi:type IV secretory pathway VirB10-like protein
MHAIKLVLLAALAACTLPAAAQWQWVDATGRKVFSDRAPPPDIPAKNILRQPGGGAPAAAPSAAPAAAATPAQPAADGAAPAAPAAAPAAKDDKTAGTDKALEEQKRKAEAQEAAKAKAEKDRVARQRQENCARARQAKTSLSSGGLLAYTNAQGERGFMDEATRDAELKRADGIIASDCGPAR